MKNKILSFVRKFSSTNKEERNESEEKEEIVVENLIENIKVSEIMIPRADLVAVAIDAKIEDITKLFLDTGFLRLLVYGKDLDDIVGFLDLRVFFPLLAKAEKLNIHKLLQKPLYTTRSTKALELFDRLERETSDLAIILDEYGGIEGMVIIEKLMAKLLAPLQKEEEKSSDVTQISENSYILDGRTSIQKVQELFTDLDFLSEEEGEYETISGFVLSYLDKVPGQGEKFSHPKGLEVTIMDANTRLVKTVKITRVPCN